MEKFSDSAYRSDWKPLIREDEPAAPRAFSGTPNGNAEAAMPAGADAQPGRSGEPQTLLDLSAEIDVLRRGLSEQSRRIDDLFGLLGQSAPSEKKRILWVPRK